MKTLTTANKQSTSSSSSRQNANNGSVSTLQRKSNNRDTDTLSGIISHKSSTSSYNYSPNSNFNSRSNGLSSIIQNSSVQTKLIIGKKNDPFEQEADQTAEKVMTSPSPKIQPILQRQEEEEEVQAKPLIQKQEEEEKEPVQTKLETLAIQRQEEEKEEPVQTKLQAHSLQRQAEEEREEIQSKPLIQKQDEEEGEPVQTKPESPTIQRKEEEEKEEPVQTKLEAHSLQKQAEEEEEEVQGKPLLQKQEEEKEEPVQAKGGTGSDVSAGFKSQLTSTRGSGQPLPDTTKSSMESGFGRDFGNVRVHTGGNAVQMSKEVGAQAFTHGSDIYFNEGKYDTGSTQGKRLLAHELTHTIQQGASVKMKQNHVSPHTIQRQEEPATEEVDLEAELAASEGEAVNAIDPGPAEKSKKEAEKELPQEEEGVVAEEPIGKEGGKKEKPTAKAPKEGKKSAITLPEKGEKEEVPKGEVGRFLEQESAGVCGQAAGKSQVLADNEQTHDDAEKKLSQTEEAVVPPTEEGQSQSNAEQVDTLDESPAPEPSEEEAKRTLNEAIDQSVPKKVKELNEFKSKGKAKVVGNKVMGTVNKETDDVLSSYNEIENAPPPKPPEKEPVELPEKEVAPETHELNLGKDAVPQLKDEHTDFTKFDQQSNGLLEKEGISEEQLDMVDEGDLFEAKKERQGLKEKVTEQPAQLQEFAQKEVQKVDKDMQQEEKKSKTDMRNNRQQGLSQTQEKQKKTKSALELKREAVTKKVNGIYEKAKSSVTTKLNNLEKQSLKAFDRGQEKASREFEDEVNRDVDRWKRKRYSGFWAGAKWLKDKIFGIDHFPEVKRAFDSAKANYIAKIDQLIVDITKENNKVIKGCKEELANARKEINKFVDTLGPELKATGQQAMAEMKSKLDEMDKFIDKKKDELTKKLCNKKEEAIKKIDEKIEKMKEAMSGALSKLGNFLLDALLKFFKWALKKAGYDEKQLMSIINKGKAVIKKIVGDPIGFIMNIVNAVKLGINNFKNNIKKHLVGGLINWLTGAMGDIGIQLPAKFDLKGILSIVLQILGLTWTSIRQKLVKRLGEKVVSGVEKTVDIVKKIITEGPMALWEMIKAKAAEIKQQVMEGIRNWAIVELVKQGIIKLISFLNPAGAIVQAILAIYNTIMFFVENWDRIVQFVKTVFNSIADMAMGKISAAAAAVEKTLAMTIPIILNFLARLLNLSGIGKAIKKIIMKIRKPIDKIVNKVIDFIAKKAKKHLKKLKGIVKKVKKGAKKAKEEIKAFLFPKHKFKAGGESHTLKVAKRGGRMKLLISSTPHPIEEFLASYESRHGDTLKKQKKDKIKTAKEFISSDIAPLVKEIQQTKKTQQTEAKLEALNRQLLQKEVRLSLLLKEILGSTGELKNLLDKYNLEGLTGTYGTMPKPKYDDLTADHQPQAAIFIVVKNMNIFKGDEGAAMRNRAANRADNGFAINLHNIRHKAGRTYGGKGTGTKNRFIERVERETKSLNTDQKRRYKVIDLIKEDMIEDVKAMREVVKDDKHWKDILGQSINIPEEKKKELKDKTKEQILSGENRVAAQDLESLKGK